MGRLLYVQNSLNGGVLSPYLATRSDLEGYTNRLEVCENFIPLPFGGAKTRPGTRFVAPAKNNGTPVLIPFEYSTLQPYMIELGDQYMRFYTPNGRIAVSSGTITAVVNNAGLVQITSAGHGLSTGHYVSISRALGAQALNKEWVITVIDANNFTLNSSVYNGGWTTGGVWVRPVEIGSPYTAAQLSQVRWAQSSDALYLVHPSVPPQRLTRASDTSWTLTQIVFIDGPYYAAIVVTPGELVSTIPLTPPAFAAGAAITVTASAALFVASDVGRLIRMQTGTAWGYVRITGFTSSTVVNATVVNSLTSTAAKLTWRLGAFGTGPGYPSVISFFQQRLVYATTAAEAQKMWFSTTGSFTDFSPSLSTGTVSASDAVTYQLGSGRVNKIRWLVTGQQLLIGTAGEEFSLTGANAEAISATNPPLVRLNSAEGCSDVPAFRVGGQTVFVQRSGREIRSVQYDFASDNFLTTESSLPAEHYFRVATVVWGAYQPRPYRVAYFVMSDGTCNVFTFYPIEKVQAWSRFTTNGSYKHVGVMANANGTSDQAWFVVERVVNSVTYRYIEREEVATNTDSNLVYTGPPDTTALSGFEHLEGGTVAVIGDNAVYDRQTVAAGNVSVAYGNTLGPAATVVECGLMIPTPTLVPVQPVPDDQFGSTRGRRKQWAKLWVSLIDTMGLTIEKTEIPYRTPGDAMDTAVPYFTGEKLITILGNDRVKTFTIRQTLPLSAHVRAYFGQMNVED